MGKFTEERKVQLLAALRRGAGRGQACQAVGISTVTLWNHMKDDEGFAQAVREAEAVPVEEVENALLRKAKNGDVRAMIFFLKCRAPERWSEVSRYEIQGMVSGQIDPEQRAVLDKVLADLEREETKALPAVIDVEDGVIEET
ncbi:MAG: hypothetical protein KKF41_08670 [Actinobacteria bacterium]|nr:hypothetical protein [Actinomycetota bacterium]MBU1942913.1 hypothetical protein [Actinomycetota bacterium]MBU2687645.1 hypothetical protein [Actinomycetota bacterium]